jgi:hypothetical protein
VPIVSALVAPLVGSVIPSLMNTERSAGRTDTLRRSALDRRGIPKP